MFLGSQSRVLRRYSNSMTLSSWIDQRRIQSLQRYHPRRFGASAPSTESNKPLLVRDDLQPSELRRSGGNCFHEGGRRAGKNAFNFEKPWIFKPTQAGGLTRGGQEDLPMGKARFLDKVIGKSEKVIGKATQNDDMQETGELREAAVVPVRRGAAWRILTYFKLRADLNSEYRDKRKDRVIANMTVGKGCQRSLYGRFKPKYREKKAVILSVNTFVKDSDDQNPLIRALAIRTTGMGCIRVERIIDYLAGPLQKCLHDENPYVRKTAAICVAKLYDLKPELVLENGFLQQLHEMISDSNPMVVANTVSALADIHTSGTSQPPTSSSDPAIFTITSTILNKLLIALNECSEWGRVHPVCSGPFQHVNASVVLGAVRVIMIHMRNVSREDFNKQLIRKMAPPWLCGQAVVKIEAGPNRSVNVLLGLIATRVSYVVQEAGCDPEGYISRIYKPSSLLFVRIRRARSKASLVWIIGEYTSKIDNADELLGTFVDTFTEESYSVQPQTLTAVVKLFLYKHDTSQGLVQCDCDPPDVRDRAYIYWRLPSTDPGAENSLASVYQKPASMFIGHGRVGAESIQRNGAEGKNRAGS
ncbi:armadillo-type protein [Lactifluus volemus]|nr:armadillo-type protein [Lactifluus volemus]